MTGTIDVVNPFCLERISSVETSIWDQTDAMLGTAHGLFRQRGG